MLQVFRFSTSKNESLFLQRKNPRKISWTVPYRRLHKKGITEEIAKKRSRKTVKHQRGIVGADMASILAKRNQSVQVRTAQRTAAIQKAKSEKKEKEAKKTKVQFRYPLHRTTSVKSMREGRPTSGYGGTQDLKAAGEGWEEWPLVGGPGVPDSSYSVDMYPHAPCKTHSPVQETVRHSGQFGEH